MSTTASSREPQESNRIDLRNELPGKESEERILDSSPDRAVVRTCEDTIRALKKFRRSVRLSIAQHNLAKDYFSNRQFYFFTLPVAIFALESSVFSFSSYYIADAEQEQYVVLCVLAVLTGIFSMGVVVLQAINRECQYKERSVLHDASVDNLKCLELEVDRALGELSDNEYRERTDWMVRTVLVKQFKDIEKGCKSEVPPYIRNAYRLLERDMESLYRHCHGTSSSSSSTSFDDFHKIAFEILFQEIRIRRLFTCSLPHPSRVKQKTLSTLFQNERDLEAEAMLWEKEQRKHREEEKLLLRQLEEAEANGRSTKMEWRRNNTGESKDEPKRQQREEEVIFYKEDQAMNV